MTTYRNAQEAYQTSPSTEADRVIRALLDYARSIESRVDSLEQERQERIAQATQATAPERTGDSERQLGEMNSRLVDEAAAMQAKIDNLTLVACRMRMALIDANEVLNEAGYPRDDGTITEVRSAIRAADALLPALSENDPWLMREPKGGVA